MRVEKLGAAAQHHAYDSLGNLAAIGELHHGWQIEEPRLRRGEAS